MIELGAWLAHAAHCRDQYQAADLARQSAILCSHQLDEPCVNTRHAVPYQPIQIIKHRIEFTLDTELYGCITDILLAGIEIELVNNPLPQHAAEIIGQSFAIDQFSVVEHVMSTVDSEPDDCRTGV